MNFRQVTLDDLIDEQSFSYIVSAANEAEVPREPAFKAPKGKMAKLLAVMKGGAWFSPLELCELTGISPLSITARVRDLRKPEYGGHNVINEEDEKGTRYRLLP